MASRRGWKQRVASSRTTRKMERMLRKMKKNGGLSLEVDSKVAREISLIFLIILVLFTFLSRTGSTGIVGQTWYNFLLYTIGIWGIYLFLGIFSLLALLLFAPRFRLNVTRFLGIVLFFVASLGFIGLSGNIELAEDANQLCAQLSGYIGCIIANLILKPTLGEMGARILLFGLFLISILLIFQKSLLETFLSLLARRPDHQEKRNKPKPTVFEDQFSIKGLETTKREEKEPKFVIQKPGNKEEKQPSSFTKQLIKTQKEMRWEFPSLELLNKGNAEVVIDEELLKSNAEKIKDKLSQFNIPVTMRDLHVGPTVMQYTLEPDEGVKLSKITALKNDLALALSAKSIRIEAPIPGKSLVGIEIPNEKRMIVHLRDVMESKDFFEIKSLLRFPLGRDVSGKPMVDALDFMPHLLIAGATGSGKSVAINSFLISLLYQNAPWDLKLILVDPKRVELSSYNALPHLLTPVITDPEKAINALRWLVAEMTHRYKACQNIGARNREEYNKKVKPENTMPYIIFVVDELADLMMTNFKKEVETLICRIAQMARAVGIHLVIATQRPSVNVITGLIKANIPARIAFSVVQSVDSRTILDSIGAEDLIGKGDMLYLTSNLSKPVRIQGVFVSSEEIEKVTNHIRLTVEPDYNEDITVPKKIDIADLPLSFEGMGSVGENLSDDQLVEQAIQVIRETGKASASLFQRRLKLGYARAARIMDMLEEQGVVGPVMGSKAREIFIDHKGGLKDNDTTY